LRVGLEVGTLNSEGLGCKVKEVGLKVKKGSAVGIENGLNVG
jgi:hypothetical protein